MTKTNERHVPVLLHETLEYLHVQPNGTYVDCTLGLGGHSSELLRRLGPDGHLIAFDRDQEAMALATERLEAVRTEMGANAPRLTLINQAFSTLSEQVEAASINGILADFGVSSLQLDEAVRGFSFRAENDGPLDMRMDQRSGPTAEQVVNQMGEKELADLIYTFGEEGGARRIARAIVRGRPIFTTGELARIVRSASPPMNKDKIHPATLTFQAIRMYVNSELDEIRSLLTAAGRILKPAGRLVVISFHSLEDRIVKDNFRDGARDGSWLLLTKKPVIAGDEEMRCNPRSRSAKMRAAEKPLQPGGGKVKRNKY